MIYLLIFVIGFLCGTAFEESIEKRRKHMEKWWNTFMEPQTKKKRKKSK